MAKLPFLLVLHWFTLRESFLPVLVVITGVLLDVVTGVAANVAADETVAVTGFNTEHMHKTKKYCQSFISIVSHIALL